MNKGDFGGYIYLDVSEDLSSYTSCSIEFNKPSGVNVLKTATLGIETVGSLVANEYVSYLVESGFLDESGQWKARLLLNTPTQSRKSERIAFQIKD